MNAIMLVFNSFTSLLVSFLVFDKQVTGVSNSYLTLDSTPYNPGARCRTAPGPAQI